MRPRESCSQWKPSLLEHALPVCLEVASATLAAEVDGLSVHVGVEVQFLDLEDGAADNAVGVVTDLGAGLDDRPRILAAGAAKPLAAAIEGRVHRLQGLSRLAAASGPPFVTAAGRLACG